MVAWRGDGSSSEHEEKRGNRQQNQNQLFHDDSLLATGVIAVVALGQTPDRVPDAISFNSSPSLLNLRRRRSTFVRRVLPAQPARVTGRQLTKILTPSLLRPTS